jgi:hypothetical protein
MIMTREIIWIFFAWVSKQGKKYNQDLEVDDNQ